MFTHNILLYHSSHHLHRHCHWHSETSLEYQTREKQENEFESNLKTNIPLFSFFLVLERKKNLFLFLWDLSRFQRTTLTELKDFGFWAWTCKPIQKLFRRSLSLSLQITHAHSYALAHTYTYVHSHVHTLPFSFHLSSCNCQLNYRLSLSLSFTSEVGDKFYQWQKSSPSLQVV